MSESGRREGSVATSLAELVQLEDDRLARERATSGAGSADGGLVRHAG